MKLFILRHGEAVDAERAGGSDEARHLTREGRRQIEQVARAMRAWKLRPAAIWSSRWVRAWQSAEIIAKELELESGIVAEPALEGPADLAPLLARLRQAGALASLMVVGHNPSLEALAGGLIAPASRARLQIKKGGLAIIDVRSAAGAGSGELRALCSPGDLANLIGG